MRLHYFDNLRAIAITLIIAGHSYGSWNQDTFFEFAFANAVTGATALFVFISGFFYREYFYKKLKYSDFLWKKFIGIGVPYLCLSCAFMAIIYMLNDNIAFPIKLPDGSDFPSSAAFVANIFTGQHLLAYWYIPFVLLLFTISPLVNIYIKRTLIVKLIVLLGMFVGAAIIHRPSLNISFVHSLLYFLPFYLLGVIYAENSKVLNSWLEEHTLLYFCVWICLVLLMTYFDQHGNAHKFNAWRYVSFDWMVPQKIALIIFLIGILKTFYNREIVYLRKISSISFGLFFIHPWVIFAIGLTKLSDYFSELWGGIFLLVMSLSIVIVILIQKLICPKSRYLIGC